MDVKSIIKVRKAADRGQTKLDWLTSYHTFSFGSYKDTEHMNFRSLRVINDDIVAPGKGFEPHSHQDMEIITVVLKGALEHKDSLGTGSVIYPGDIQRMSAGTGIEHSEFNHSKTEPVHLLQIWLFPLAKGREPSYEQKSFLEYPDNKLKLVASPDGRHGSVTVYQDVFLYRVRITPGTLNAFKHAVAPSRKIWVQVTAGEVCVNGRILHPGDGVGIEDEKALRLLSAPGGECLIFDLV